MYSEMINNLSYIMSFDFAHPFDLMCNYTDMLCHMFLAVAIVEISSRLELMDKRLDTEFTVLNYGIGAIGSVLLAYTSMKFMSLVFRFITY